MDCLDRLDQMSRSGVQSSVGRGTVPNIQQAVGKVPEAKKQASSQNFSMLWMHGIPFFVGHRVDGLRGMIEIYKPAFAKLLVCGRSVSCSTSNNLSPGISWTIIQQFMWLGDLYNSNNCPLLYKLEDSKSNTCHLAATPVVGWWSLWSWKWFIGSCTWSCRRDFKFGSSQFLAASPKRSISL